MNINSFAGGMGNDEFLLGQGQFVYSENLDIYRDPRKIQLAVKPSNFATSIVDFPVLMVSDGAIASASRNTYFCLENKDIIDGEGDVHFDGSVLRPKGSGAGLATASGNWRSIINVGVSAEMYFFDYKGGIIIPYFVNTGTNPNWFRATGTKDWTDMAFDMVYDDTTSTLSATGVTRPVYDIGDKYFFADDSNHRQLLRTSASGGMPGYGAGDFGPGYPTITAYPQGISQPGATVFASVHSDSVWTIGNRTTALYSEMAGISVVAGASSEGVKQLQTNVPIKFLHGTNKNNMDILVAGNVESTTDFTNGTIESQTYSSIYIYSWLGFGAGAVPLMAKSRYHPNIATAYGHHGVTYYLAGIFGLTDYNWAAINDLVYVISNKDDVGLIYAYGKSVGGTNDAWSIVVSKNSQGKALKRIGCLYRNYAKNGFYYTYEDEDGVFGVDYYDDISIDTPTSYQPSGKIFLRTDDGGDMSVKKEVKILTLGCEVPADTSITISYILDNGTEQTYETITPTTQGTNVYKNYKGNTPIKGFKCISWFATLNTTGTNTPSIYNFNYELGAIQ